MSLTHNEHKVTKHAKCNLVKKKPIYTYLDGGLVTEIELGALEGISFPSPTPLSSTGKGVLSLGPLCDRWGTSGLLCVGSGVRSLGPLCVRRGDSGLVGFGSFDTV